MHVNADFLRRVVVTPRDHRWVASPQPGVERVMLDRVGDERARATSLVRYARGSSFPRHGHPGGEEILVLWGTFSADGEAFPAGWYLRNPPGSSHQPASAEGAVIFVKLWQMRADEERPVRVDTRDAAVWHREDARKICPLFSNAFEQVRLLQLAPGAVVLPDPVEGAELFVIEGAVVAGDDACPAGSWLRLPAGRHRDIRTDVAGATLYMKTGRVGDLGLFAAERNA